MIIAAPRPAVMGRVLGIVYRTLATHQIRKAGYSHRGARTGAVKLNQRFGGALNLNIHFHMPSARRGVCRRARDVLSAGIRMTARMPARL